MVGQLHGDADGRASVGDIRRLHVYSPDRDAHTSGRDQEYMAVDAGTRVPATVSPFVADFDSQYVVALFVEQVGYIEIECGIAVGVFAYLRAVDPQFRVAVHAVEEQNRLAALRQAWC